MGKMLTGLTLLGLPLTAGAAVGSELAFDFTQTIYGYLGIVIFVAAYVLVPLENHINLRKSKPVLLAGGLIWVLVAVVYAESGDPTHVHEAIRHSLLEYAELFLFLLVAMTYINALQERNVFQALRAYLVSKGFSLRGIFWSTGLLAFFLSPIADNLTTALLMGTVVMAIGASNRKFVALACINIVVAANAGGAFSPFGDITTLMVWQKGRVEFTQFFMIVVPSIVNWLVPAVLMSLALDKTTPTAVDERISMKYGATVMIGLFIVTIATAVSFHNFLHLPPAAGMMLGLGYLGAYSFFLQKREGLRYLYSGILGAGHDESRNPVRLLRQYGKDVGKHLDKQSYPAFMIDASHRVVHWNSALEKLTGMSAEEMVGTKKQWQAFYAEERPVLADLVIDSVPKIQVGHFYAGIHQVNPASGEAFDACNFFEHLGDKGKWLLFSAAPVRDEAGNFIGALETFEDMTEQTKRNRQFSMMKSIAHAEWDTLLFFYGVILCVGGLSQFGYLALVSELLYTDLGATMANSLVGVLSAIIDNIPVMFAVLTMDPAMSLGQWLLVTLTAGVGGSLLAIGSAAGVALLGTARGLYTFGAHLKWTPAIALGYVLSIYCHLVINQSVM